jgi:hypothetical protein
VLTRDPPRGTRIPTTAPSLPAARRLDLLLTPGFLAALALLGANDFALKPALGTWLTGKLSDVAGLFALPLLLIACWPRRTRALCIGTALAFAWWKSPLADGAIAAWNALGVWPVARVVDYTDLVAVASVPAAAGYARRARGTRASRALCAVVAASSALLFAATSRIFIVPDGTWYVVRSPRELVRPQLDSLARRDSTLRLQWLGRSAAADTFVVLADPSAGATARAELRAAPGGETIITLLQLRRGGGYPPPDVPRTRERFVERVVLPLRTALDAAPPDADSVKR